MTGTFVTALVALVPAGMLFAASVLQFLRRRSAAFLLQLMGTAGLMIVVLSHVCEALGLLPWMGWGLERSAGHYVDLAAAVVAVGLFPLGYLLDALKTA